MTELISQNFNLHSLKIPAQTAGMKVFYSAGLTHVDSGLSCDTFNIIHITNGRALTATELTNAINHYRHKSYAFCIWISEEERTEQVQAILSELGVVEQNNEPGMILDLQAWQPVQHEWHASIRIVQSLQDLSDFSAVIAKNWTPPDQNVIDYYNKVSGNILDERNNLILAVCYADQQPASTVELFPSDDATVGLYGLATLADFRGKGIGSAVMSFALNTAKERGYKHAILQASADGLNIYQRLGFRVITHYYEYA